MYEESDLINRAVAGEGKAFDRLIRPLQEQVYRRCLKATKDHDAADDVAQEVYIKAYTKLHQFRKGCKFSTWVYVITTRCILMHFRSVKRKQAERLDELGPYEYEQALISMNHPAPAQDDFVSASQTLMTYESAMKRMNPKYKGLLDLWITGNSLKQIGVITGLGLPATKTRIYRARQQLRKLAA